MYTAEGFSVVPGAEGQVSSITFAGKHNPSGDRGPLPLNSHWAPFVSFFSLSFKSVVFEYLDSKMGLLYHAASGGVSAPSYGSAVALVLDPEDSINCTPGTIALASLSITGADGPLTSCGQLTNPCPVSSTVSPSEKLICTHTHTHTHKTFE